MGKIQRLALEQFQALTKNEQDYLKAMTQLGAYEAGKAGISTVEVIKLMNLPGAVVRGVSSSLVQKKLIKIQTYKEVGKSSMVHFARTGKTMMRILIKMGAFNNDKPNN